MEHEGPVRPDGSLDEAAIELLYAVSGVSRTLLQQARIRPSRSNWLRAPWYCDRRGGAITLGRTIWLTRIWFDPARLGDRSLRSTRKWLLLLAHEVGHLPQVERSGRDFFGKARYVASFAWQYGTRAALFRRPVHDGSRLEREADMGRWVLARLFTEDEVGTTLVEDVLHGDTDGVRAWCAQAFARIAELRGSYRAMFLP